MPFSVSIKLIGQRIGHHRRKKQMTQTELAERVGVSSRTLGKIERGYDARLSVLLAIAEALDMPVADLMQLPSRDDCLSSLTSAEREAICQHLKAIVALLPTDADLTATGS